MSYSEQKKIVENTESQLKSHLTVVRLLEHKLKAELAVLQTVCKHTDVARESDGDYHKPTYYVTCRDCLLCVTERIWKRDHF